MSIEETLSAAEADLSKKVLEDFAAGVKESVAAEPGFSERHPVITEVAGVFGAVFLLVATVAAASAVGSRVGNIGRKVE